VRDDFYDNSFRIPGAFKYGEDAVGYLRVEVTESGVGLSEDEQARVFGEFAQFDRNELQGGGIIIYPFRF
jgi:signal transduction histidine kinase